MTYDATYTYQNNWKWKDISSIQDIRCIQKENQENDFYKKTSFFLVFFISGRAFKILRPVFFQLFFGQIIRKAFLHDQEQLHFL